MTTLIRRIVRGDDWRKSRFHDMRGNFAGLRGLATDLPRALSQAALRRGAGKYPALPWIPYPAMRTIQGLVRPDWKVLEHGGGMSTVWWAQRVSHVDTIEANATWCKQITQELAKRNLSNVSLELRADDAHYTDLSMFGDQSFDCIVIDGHARDAVAADAFRLLKSPGVIYLDNTDFGAQWEENYGVAEAILKSVADEHGGHMTYFSGFPPATFQTNQGLLITFP